MKFKTNYLYLLLMPVIALGFYRIFNPPPHDDKNTEITQESVTKTSTEDIPTITTISLDSLTKLGIKITLWMESPEDFERIHKVKLYRNKYEPSPYFQSKEEIKHPYLWFEKKNEMELVLYSWHKNKTNIDYLLRNKDKKFVVIGLYDGKEFEGTLFEY